MNPRDVDILMGEIRCVLEVTVGQLASLLRDMADVVGAPETPG